MHNISMGQALDVWTELMLAHAGTNTYGGNTAEIYAHRLSPHNPCKHANGPLTSKWNREVNNKVKASFLALLRHFEQHLDCMVLIDGQTTDTWDAATPDGFTHRAHVTVEENC